MDPILLFHTPCRAETAAVRLALPFRLIVLHCLSSSTQDHWHVEMSLGKHLLQPGGYRKRQDGQNVLSKLPVFRMNTDDR